MPQVGVSDVATFLQERRASGYTIIGAGKPHMSCHDSVLASMTFHFNKCNVTTAFAACERESEGGMSASCSKLSVVAVSLVSRSSGGSFFCRHVNLRFNAYQSTSDNHLPCWTIPIVGQLRGGRMLPP
jgi:hypothetical protein